METIYHSKANECPPGKHDLVPLMDNHDVVGVVCQRCGKKTYEMKGEPTGWRRTPVINENGELV